MSTFMESLASEGVDIAEMASVLSQSEEARALLDSITDDFYFSFRPRPDKPERYDEQQSFVEDQIPGVAGLLGGNACLGGEQKLFDPVLGLSRRIDSIKTPFWVWSYNRQSCDRELARSTPPFVKGVAPLFRIHLSTGRSFVSTLGHRVLGPDGQWREVGELRNGDNLLSPPGRDAKAPPFSHVDSVVYLRTDTFYDVHVPGNNNYLCEGVVHSNSGTSEAASYKLSQFVLNRQPPPRADTPFWIVGPKLDQTIKTFWKEKLFGHGHIPTCEVDWKRIRWHSEKQALPISVPLLPWPEDRGGNRSRNWCLEFRSFAEGAAVMTAESIGGFMLSEPFPRELLTEILRATREYNYPGAHFFELTPVDPAMTYWIEEMIIDDKVPSTWKFYRCNTACNAEDPNSVVSQQWADEFFASVSDEMTETRMTGAFASYEGLIYQSFNRAVHVIDEDELVIPNADVIHKRSVDWGASVEHPLALLFGFKDPLGVWTIYDEYHSTDQTMTWEEHCEQVKSMRKWPKNNPHFRETYGDPSRPDLFREWSRHGIPISPARNDVDEGIESVRRCLKSYPLIGPKLRISSRCKNLIKEMYTYRWMKSSGRGLNPTAARPVPLKRMDDLADCLRYLIHSDYRSTLAGVSGYRSEPRQRPQVRHKRMSRR